MFTITPCNFSSSIGPSCDTDPAPSVKIMSPSRRIRRRRRHGVFKRTGIANLLKSRQSPILRANASPVMPSIGCSLAAINVQHHQRVGVVESGRKFVHQIAGAGVAMRLEDDVDLAIAALPRRRQRRPNLGRMMAVVVNHADARGLPAQLKAPVHAAEILQRVANLRIPECRVRCPPRLRRSRSARCARPGTCRARNSPRIAVRDSVHLRQSEARRACPIELSVARARLGDSRLPDSCLI